MKHTTKMIPAMLLTALSAGTLATAKPLKVYIMAGQSNMQGHAGFNTLPYMLEDPATVALHNRMVDKDGKPKVHEAVHVSLLTDYGTNQGPLTAGFGARKTSLGPELAFGATMHEKLQEPILIIKTAWGGKSLHTDFRPPSAGPYVYDPKVLEGLVQRGKGSAEELNASKAKATGVFYRLMLDHVKMVLADPAKYHPAYKKEDGYEIAGFVWFQGYNDLTDGNAYPNRGAPGSYDAYTEVLRHFIRDVRKDLDAPQLPFVIGVLGMGGSYLNNTLPENSYLSIYKKFQKAMAAPADLPEFKGNVFAVHTGLYWDSLQAAADKKKWKINGEAKGLVKQGKLDPKEQADYERKRLAEVHTPEEAIAFKGISNQTYHYLGSAKILSRIGEGLAEALINKKGNPKPAGLKPPLHGLEEVGYQNVHLEGGFWEPRLDRHHRTTIPHVLDKLEERKHIANFDVAAKVLKGEAAKQGATDPDQAGQALEGNAGNHGPGSDDPKGAKDGEITGHSAFDSDLHKALEGACYTLGHVHDPALHKRVDSILDRILAAQEKDGYLVSYFTAKEPQNKWANMRLNHEDYNAGHFFEFAVAHHQLNGSTKALEAAKRFADHIDRIFGPGKRYEVGGHQEIELALISLYRATGEKRYLDLCRFFLEERGHLHGTERKPFTEIARRGDPEKLPGEEIRDWRRRKWSMRNGRMQDHKPILQQTEAEGHAVRAGYMYSAMADVERFSESPEYAEVLGKLWEDVVFRKMYLTGGIGTAQYGDEGFGDPYLLPNKTYCESCASIGHVFWQHRMNLLTGEAQYADVMELVLYNSALSGMSLKGDSYFYQNPLESTKGAARSEWIGLACCPTSHARFTPQVGGYVYAHADDRLFVNLFAAGEAAVTMDKDRVVKIAQQTKYPWDGQVKLTVNPEKPSDFDLCVRIPGWALGRPVPGDLYRFTDPQTTPVTLKVNGEPVAAKPGPDGYVHLKRSWKAGDRVELDLPMPVRRVLAHEKVEANKGKVALMRGPVVYCLEGVDNKDVNLFKISLPKSAELTAVHRSDLLEGVTVVRTTGMDENRKPVKLSAIPYYAWANREKTPMTIWIKDSADAPPDKTPGSRWSPDKANQWYAKQPWPCGFNYIPANAVNYTEMWMPYNFDPELIGKELALAEDIGFNCLRVVLPFVVWEHDPEAFKKRLDTFLGICDKHGIKVMFCIFEDCGELRNPEYGRQLDVIKGAYANAWSASPGDAMVLDPATWPRLERYLKDVIGSFKDDSRVLAWDLYNEPTNGGMGKRSLPLVTRAFEWARAGNPSAPLTVGVWNKNEELNTIALGNSDIITFHNYHNADKLVAGIESLKTHGRPIINTEWLCRHQDSTPQICLPVFARENVGCMHWGLVNGKTQTHLHWGARPGRPEPKVWQHDLFHGDHTPYNKEEIELFQRTISEQAKRPLSAAAAVAAPTPPNIIFIMADDMGFGDPGCYNPESKIPTPHMDKFAANGLRFTDAHTPAAVCTPTRYSVLTGRYCWRRKAKGVLGGYGPPLIENTRPTIASILKKQGYTTACIGKWHIGATFHNREGKRPANEKDIDFTAPVTDGPNALGFDYAYWNAGCGTIAPPYGFIENEHFVSKSFSYQKMPHGDSGMVEQGWVTANADPIITAKACEFIRKSASANKPFFLYLAPNAPHEPCVEAVVPEFARGKSKAGHRGDLVWLFDWIVGQVVETLEATGQAGNTMIIITSDNGALPGDYALDKNGKKMSRPGGNWVFEDFGHKSSGELRGYKAHIWEGGHRVPLIVHWPGKVKASTVSDEIICLTDFVATAAAIIGVNLPDDAGEDSVNMLPALLGQSSPDKPLREAIVHHSSDGVFAIRQGKWKLILDSQGSGGWPPPRGGAPVPGTPGQLYELEADPGERTNLWDKQKDIVASLTTLLERYQKEGRSVPARK